MNKHTPAPWRLVSWENRPCIIHTNGATSGNFEFTFVAKDVASNDANLITIAPELLYLVAQARTIRNMSDCLTDSEWERIWKKWEQRASAAIAKA